MSCVTRWTSCWGGMKFYDDALRRYLERAPAALAIERMLECRILAQQAFRHPILDLGCGDGLFAATLFAERIDVGIDIDAREIARARQLNAYNELVVCSASCVPKPDASFASVFSNSVLEHIPELDPVLAEVRRLLVPRGCFYVTVPTDRFDLYSTLGRLLNTIGNEPTLNFYRAAYNRFWQHYNVHDEPGWRRVFMQAGFEICETRSYDSRGVCLLNDLLAPAALPAMFSKKLLGRWIVVPGLRRWWVPAINRVLGPIVDRLENDAEGGLLFLSLRKP
jgi:SAM-dependent methyltransferase